MAVKTIRERLDQIRAYFHSQPETAKQLPMWQELQLGMLLGKLSDWRNADHQDEILLGRSDIIAILDGFKALGRKP